MPAAPTATPEGKLKLAAAPVPSALPEVPPPASVVTTPAGEIWRILWLPESATVTVPSVPTATPNGALKLAAAPVPSALPAAFAAEPAHVATVATPATCPAPRTRVRVTSLPEPPA